MRDGNKLQRRLTLQDGATKADTKTAVRSVCQGGSEKLTQIFLG